jgi:hypothetical protein
MSSKEITLQDLIDAVPDNLKAIIMEFGPALLKMAAEELKKWIKKIINGDVLGAYRMLVTNMDGSENLDEWDKINEEWDNANEENAERIQLQKTAAMAVLKALLAAIIGILI